MGLHDHLAFQAAIAANRQDLLPPFVYSDYLSDHEALLGDVLRTETEAAQIMGRENVPSVLDVLRHFQTPYTPIQLQSLSVIPFTAETLRGCRNTHILVPGHTLNLEDLRRLHPEQFYDLEWLHQKALHRRNRGQPRWYLLRKTVAPNTLSIRRRKQLARLGPQEEVPRICEMAYMLVLHQLVHQSHLFEGVYGNCSDSWWCNCYGERFAQIRRNRNDGCLWLNGSTEGWFDGWYNTGLCSSRKPDIR
jgi:hypothetical protein